MVVSVRYTRRERNPTAEHKAIEKLQQEGACKYGQGPPVISGWN